MREQIESAIVRIIHINLRGIHAIKGATGKKHAALSGLLERRLSFFDLLGIVPSLIDLDHIASICTPRIQFQVFIVQKFTFSSDLCTANCEVLAIFSLEIIRILSVIFHFGALSTGICSCISLYFGCVLCRRGITCFYLWLRFHWIFIN